jgi:hypothetical protein
VKAAAVATSVKERPILFSGPMVKAIREGRKTQTRRIIQPQPEKKGGGWYWSSPRYDNGDGVHYFHAVILTPSLMEAWQAACPYGVTGERLWVREAFRQGDGSMSVHYRADPDEVSGGPWRPSIFMPRWASRLTLEITNVRVQRLQEISEEDARAEGVVPLESIGADQPILDTVRGRTHGTHPHVLAYAVTWDTLNDERAPWVSNPWIWAITFRRVA